MRFASLTPVVFAALASTSIAQSPTGYYNNVNVANPLTLRQSLHGAIDDHRWFPYTSSSTDTWDILKLADQDPGNSSNVLTIYRNASYKKETGGNNNYNREHTWPKSYGFPSLNSSNYPYTDCHQLFLCDSGYNSSRSNKPFGLVGGSGSEKTTLKTNGTGGGTGTYPGNSNWTSGSFTQGRWEVWRDRRGDMARAMFYMDVRYEGGKHGNTNAAEPDLRLTDDEHRIDLGRTSSNASIAYMGMLDILLQWHEEDPVDDRERRRNNQVYAYQKNRNPFVDHPEWASMIFQQDCSGASYYLGSYPNMRQQILDGDLIGTKRTLTSIAHRLDDRLHSGTATGRSWKKVSLTLSNGPTVGFMSSTFGTNVFGSPKLVSSGARSWPTITGNPNGSPEPWGGKSKEYLYTFSSPYAYTGKTALLQDWVFSEGKLANGGTWGSSDFLGYYLDAQRCGPAKCQTLDGVRSPTYFGCRDGTITSTDKFVHAQSHIAWCNYDNSHPMSKFRNKSRIAGYSHFTAKGQMVIHVWGVPTAQASGIPIGALCENLHVDLTKPAIYFFQNATNNSSAWSGWLPGPNFDSGLVKMTTSLFGERIVAQAAWTETNTKRMGLTKPSVIIVPSNPTPCSAVPKNSTYRDSTSSTTGYGPFKSEHWYMVPLTRYTGS